MSLVWRRMKPLLDVPLKNFPQASGRFDDLYELRAGVVRKDGFFVLKCDPGDHFVSSFPLMMENTGAYMVGRILASRSKHMPDRIYYDVYIHGGSLDISCFCTSPEELLGVINNLEERGMEYVFVENESWGICDDDTKPFDELFTEFPSDPRFAMIFGDGMFDESSEKRLGEYFEQ